MAGMITTSPAAGEQPRISHLLNNLNIDQFRQGHNRWSAQTAEKAAREGIFLRLADILAATACVNCKGNSTGVMNTCSEGHYICPDCKTLLGGNCLGVCNYNLPLTPIRNHPILEFLGKLRIKPCPYTDKGCGFSSANEPLLISHSTTCAWRDTQCSFCVIKCGDRRDLIRHIEFDHYRTVNTTRDISKQFKLVLREGESTKHCFMWRHNERTAVIAILTPINQGGNWGKAHTLTAYMLGETNSVTTFLKATPMNPRQRMHEFERTYRIPDFGTEEYLSKTNPAMFHETDLPVDKCRTRRVALSLQRIYSKNS